MIMIVQSLLCRFLRQEHESVVEGSERIANICVLLIQTYLECLLLKHFGMNRPMVPMGNIQWTVVSASALLSIFLYVSNYLCLSHANMSKYATDKKHNLSKILSRGF